MSIPLPKTTQALVAEARNTNLNLTTLTLPTTLQPNEALIRIIAVGICHAELSVLNGTIPSPFPRVLGHEGAGEVVALGSGVLLENVDVGSKVLLSFSSCGSCGLCASRNPAYCTQQTHMVWSGDATSAFKRDVEKNGSRGIDQEDVKGGFFGQSSLAQYAIVHESCIVAVPGLEEEDMRLLAPLGCAVQTGVGTVTNVLDVQEGMSVAVFGTGAVGMCAIMGAKMRGAAIIIAVDMNADRLQLAMELGATHTILSSRDNSTTLAKIIEICREESPDGSGVQRAVDTTGVPALIETMVSALGLLGRAAVVGAPATGTTAAIDVVRLLQGGRSIIGATEGDNEPQKFIPYLLTEYANNRLPLSKIVKHYQIEDFETAFADMRAGKTIKPVLVWH